MGVSVLFDNEWMKEYNIETVMVNATNKEIGLAVGSKERENDILVCLYKLIYDYNEGIYSLGSFFTSVTCNDEEDKLNFLNSLPEMIHIFDLESVQ